MTLLLITMFTTSLSAQSDNPYEDYFIGKWNLVVKGLADYDINLVLDVKKIEGTIKGEVEIPGYGEPPSELIGIVMADSTFAGTTTGLGFDMPLIVTRKDDKNVTGSMMGMPLEGVRSDQNN